MSAENALVLQGDTGRLVIFPTRDGRLRAELSATGTVVAADMDWDAVDAVRKYLDDWSRGAMAKQVPQPAPPSKPALPQGWAETLRRPMRGETWR